MTDPSEETLCVAALYRFSHFDDPSALRGPLLDLCRDAGAKGTILLATEGINGTIAGNDAAIARILDHIRALPGCADLDVKYSRAATMPFGRMKVRVKQEIVTLGAGALDPLTHAGIYVEPKDWNALIADPDTILIDTRNEYEVGIGSFSGAINPHTRSFREFPRWFDALTDGLKVQGRTPKIAMYCTGGIRCEKSTAYARSIGMEQVYHLRGGILRYLEEVPAQESLWRGACFVFDERVSVTHGLVQGDDIMCRRCGLPHDRGEPHDCSQPTSLSQDEKKAAPEGGY